MMLRTSIFALAVSLIAALPASAQVNAGPVYAGVPDIMMPVVMNPCLGRCGAEEESEGSAVTEYANPAASLAARGAATPAPQISPTELNFAPSATRRRQNLAGFVSKVRQKDPQEAAQLQQLFASTDIVDQIDGLIAPLGLSTDNVADAYALWWVSAWNGARGLETNPSRAQLQAVRQQAETALVSTPQLAGANDAQKQEMAESLLLQAVLIDQAVTAAQGDAAMLRRIGAAVKQGAAAAKVDLDAMVLTPAGFETGD